MKNNVKNALNALGLLVFMGLAWATQKTKPTQILKMEVAVNADSTAFLLKNLEETEFTNGNVTLSRTTAKTQVDSLIALQFFKDSVTVKAKSTLTIPFGKLAGLNSTNKIDTFSKRLKPQSFNYFVLLPKQVDGLFTFDFK